MDDGHKAGKRRQQRVERGRVLGVMKPPKDPSLSCPQHLPRGQSKEVRHLDLREGHWRGIVLADRNSSWISGLLWDPGHVVSPLWTRFPVCEMRGQEELI